MYKKTIMKVLAIIVCLCILSLSVPNAIAAERDVKKFDFKVFVKRSATMFYSLFPLLSPILDSENNITSSDKINKSDGKIRVSGMLKVYFLSDGD